MSRSRDKKRLVANDLHQMHGFNLKTTITTAAAIIKSRVYKCRIQNDKSNTLTHAAVEVIVGHISARQSWRCGSHPVKQPAHDVTRNSSARAEHCAMRARTHTHRLLILSLTKDQSTRRSFLTNQLTRSLNISF